MFAQRATFVLGIMALAPSLSSPGEDQVDHKRRGLNTGGKNSSPAVYTLELCHHIPGLGSWFHKCETKHSWVPNRRGPNQKPLHHPCLLGGRLFGEGGHKQARAGNGQKKMPSALTLPPKQRASVLKSHGKIWYPPRHLKSPPLLSDPFPPRGWGGVGGAVRK